MTLDIVIVNWNAGDALAECIGSIPAALGQGVELRRVVVVDNASTDGSAKRLAAEGLPLTVYHNPRNVGFAAACNQGASGSDADCILFLNPDTKLFADSLRVPLDFLADRRNAQVGIVGVQLVDDSGQVARSCARFPSVRHFYVKMLGLDRLLPRHFRGFTMEDWAHDATRDVDQVIGAFFLVRRALFESLRGFDERFFVYFEELDFSLRARASGWRSVYLTEAQAYHQGCGTTDQAKAARLFYSLRSRLLYARKHYSGAALTALALGTLVVEPATRLARAATRLSWNETRETLLGTAWLWRAVPTTFRPARGDRG